MASITLGVPENVRELMDETIEAYRKYTYKNPDFIHMSDAMFRKLREECCGATSAETKQELPDKCRGMYRGIEIIVFERMPEGTIEAGEWG